MHQGRELRGSDRAERAVKTVPSRRKSMNPIETEHPLTYWKHREHALHGLQIRKSQQCNISHVNKNS